MKKLTRCFKSLESAGFLRTLENSDTVPTIELLTHGYAYAVQLQHQWLTLRNLAVHFDAVKTESPDINSSRLSFVQSKHFRDHVEQLRKYHPRKAKCPTLMKYQEHMLPSKVFVSSTFTHNGPVTQLITDFLVEPHRGQEHFYNMQRESKIWWMRFSTNPSRFVLAPFDLQEKSTRDYQAIDIKLKFDADDVTVEQLTLASLPQTHNFELPDARTGRILKPVVIRSAIELEPATCALLLDGCDHGRSGSSLLLNRVLAPYQCAIACLQRDERWAEDLCDLCSHFAHVLQRAGLRLCKQRSNYVCTTNSKQLAEHMQNIDTLGVPYALLLDEQTLQNGMLQLRNRDTKLTETIHISDVPDYLLNIFRN